jgi:hypothetical protein
MIPTESTTTRSTPQREVVETRDGMATLTCPNCLGTLKIKADTRAAAPCPICQYPLVYEPPAPAVGERFPGARHIEPMRARSPQPRTPAAATPPAQRKSFRTLLKEADDYINSPAGTSLSWILLAVLLAACVALFFHWDHERRERSRVLEAIESQRPAIPQRPSTSSVPLLPGEPAPAVQEDPTE